MTEQFAGIEEDEECGRDGCEGWLEWEDIDCICAAIEHPPCGRCENRRLWCPECGWTEER